MLLVFVSNPIELSDHVAISSHEICAPADDIPTVFLLLVRTLS